MLPADDPPGSVSVVGDFNDWTPGTHALVKRTNGTRSVSANLPADVPVTFRYLASDGHWFDEADADEVTAEGSLLRL